MATRRSSSATGSRRPKTTEGLKSGCPGRLQRRRLAEASRSWIRRSCIAAENVFVAELRSAPAPRSAVPSDCCHCCDGSVLSVRRPSRVPPVFFPSRRILSGFPRPVSASSTPAFLPARFPSPRRWFSVCTPAVGLETTRAVRNSRRANPPSFLSRRMNRLLPRTYSVHLRVHRSRLG